MKRPRDILESPRWNTPRVGELRTQLRARLADLAAAASGLIGRVDAAVMDEDALDVAVDLIDEAEECLGDVTIFLMPAELSVRKLKVVRQEEAG